MFSKGISFERFDKLIIAPMVSKSSSARRFCVEHNVRDRSQKRSTFSGDRNPSCGRESRAYRDEKAVDADVRLSNGLENVIR
jgi:hypothetical protein